MIDWLKDHYFIFGTYAVLLFTGRWDDLKALHEFMKDPAHMKVEEVDFDLYDDLEEDVWK